MSMNPTRKNYLLRGTISLAFPAYVFLVMHFAGKPLPMPLPIFFGVLIVIGVRAMMVGLFGLDPEGVFSWVVDAAVWAGIAALSFWAAWAVKDGWFGGVPGLPHGWNQMIPRVLFAGVGSLCVPAAGRCLLKAYHVYRKRPDERVRHTAGNPFTDDVSR